MSDIPASPGTRTRRAAVNRPKNTARPRRRRTYSWAVSRWRSRRSRMTGSRPSVPWRSLRPHRRPIRYPTEFPTTAPSTAAAMAAPSELRPWEARTPPRMTASSPGNRKPRKAEDSNAGRANTIASATPGGSARIRSVMPARIATEEATTPVIGPSGIRRAYRGARRSPPSPVGCGDPRGDELVHLGRFAGPGEQESLGPIAAQRLQRSELALRFDPFGHDGQAEGVRQVDDGGHDGVLGSDVAHAADERPVDLDEIERELPQVRERGVPGAEVVQANLDPAVPQGPQTRHGGVRRLHEHALGHLDMEVVARQPVAVERGHPLLRDPGVGQVARRDVDADAREAGGPEP